MEITFHTSGAAWTLVVNGVAFDVPLDAAQQVTAQFNTVADQLKSARWALQTRAFEVKAARPDFYPTWPVSQGLTILVRDGYLRDRGTLRTVGAWTQAQSAYDFGWLLHLADTYTYDRFTREIRGLGDKRLHSLKEALKAFKAAHPDQLYSGRLP